MPWTVEYGYARTRDEQDNPPEGMMIKVKETFHSKKAAMDHAAFRLSMDATNAIVRNGDGEVVADTDQVHTHANPPKPTGE